MLYFGRGGLADVVLFGGMPSVQESFLSLFSLSDGVTPPGQLTRYFKLARALRSIKAAR